VNAILYSLLPLANILYKMWNCWWDLHRRQGRADIVSGEVVNVIPARVINCTTNATAKDCAPWTAGLWTIIQVICPRSIKQATALYCTPYGYITSSSRDANMPETVTVQVAQGGLRGRKLATKTGATYYSFRGIPYAKPPVGELRFKVWLRLITI
jgi:hypothetical protein